MKTGIGLIGANLELRAGMVAANYPRDIAEIRAICDRDPAMLEKYRKNHPESKCRLYTAYWELLADPAVDAIFVMVRDQYHEEIAIGALEAGKAVYLEKPMALSIEGCDRILETAFRTGSKLFVGHNMRYVASILKMKEIIDSGAIGEIQCVWVRHFVSYGSCYFRHWCAGRETCNGLLLQKGAHDIDVIHWLAGGYSSRVTAMGKLSVYNRNVDRLKEGEAPDRQASFRVDCWPPLEIRGLAPHPSVEDHSMLLMQLDNGVQASYEQCMYTPDSERNYTFIGTRGRLENIGDFGDCQIHVWNRRGERKSPDIIHHLKAEEGGHGGSDPAILKDFLAFLREGKSPNVSPVAARYAVASGCLGHQSMRNRNIPYDVPPVNPELLEYFQNGQKKH